jgi:hypothetical protein
MSRRHRARGIEPENMPADIPASGEPCPGQCNREWRAAEATAAAELLAAQREEREPRRLRPHGITPHLGRPYWCTTVPRYDLTGMPVPGAPDHYGCADRIEADLRSLPELAALLTPGPLNTPRDVAELGAGLGIDPPTNSPAWDDIEGVIRWACLLEDRVRTKYEHPPAAITRPLTMPVYEWRWWTAPAPRPGGWRRVQVRREFIGKAEMPRLLGDAVAYLAAELPRILRDADLAVTVGQQIMTRRRSLEQDTGTGRLIHRLPGICMVCKRKGLRRTDGSELVKCPSCGACWDWEHYRLLARGYGHMVRGDV